MRRVFAIDHHQIECQLAAQFGDIMLHDLAAGAAQHVTAKQELQAFTSTTSHSVTIQSSRWS